MNILYVSLALLTVGAVVFIVLRRLKPENPDTDILNNTIPPKSYQPKTVSAKPAAVATESPAQPVETAIVETRTAAADVTAPPVAQPQSAVVTEPQVAQPAPAVTLHKNAANIPEDATLRRHYLTQQAQSGSSASTAKISAVPEDSTLKRHFLTQLQAEFEAASPRPSDSTLKRHYDSLIKARVAAFVSGSAA